MEDNQIIINEDYGNIEETTQESGIDAVVMTEVDNPTIDATETGDIIPDTNDMTVHNNLHDRDVPGAHPISAITNLRAELDSLSTQLTPQTVYSDKYGVADYYAWRDGLRYDNFGYFVSIVPRSNKIEICKGADVFGVTVDKNRTAFIGGYDKNKDSEENGYDNSYALVATSGYVDVRCATDVGVGDYVVPYVVQDNDNNLSVGMAKKSESGYGYKVVAIDKWGADPYATIAFNIPADQIDKIGTNVGVLNERMDDAHVRISEAMMAAARAEEKANSAIDSNNSISDKVNGAYDCVEDIQSKVSNIYQDIQDAKNDAITHTNTAIKDAIDDANDKWAQANEDLEGNVKTAMGQQEERLMSYAKREADEVFSLLTSVDQYSVGPYSQTYGLTLSQARAILSDAQYGEDIQDKSFFYIPTPHGDDSTHKEVYAYTDKDIDPESEINETHTFYEQFSVPYCYEWKNGTHTIEMTDEDGNAADLTFDGYWWDGRNGIVAFDLTREPSPTEFEFWYTNGNVSDDLKNKGYESYTLYVWRDEKVDEETGNVEPRGWKKVNTLADNVNNRLTSMISHTADGIALEVTNTQESVAHIGGRIEKTHSEVESLSRWRNGEDSSDAIIRQKTDKDGNASIVISTVKKTGDTVTSEASLTLMCNKDNESALSINADQIDFDAGTYTINADHIRFTADDYKVISENIDFDASAIRISADQIEFDVDGYEIDASKIVFSTGDFGGRNLLLGTSKSYTITAGGDPAKYQTYECAIPLKKGDTYSIGADVNAVASFGGEVNKITIEITDGTNIDRFTLSIKDNHIVGTITLEKVIGSITQLLLHAGESGGVGAGKITFSNVKLEEGLVSTAWTPAPEDQVSTEQTSSVMNWKMLPDKCVWWNQDGSESDFLMKLDGTGLYVKGNGEFTGKITAESGKIGTWEIGTVPKAYVDTANSTSASTFTNALYSTTFGSTSNGETAGMTTILRASNYDTDWAYITIKKNTDDTYEDVFGIRHDGFLKATNADLKGKITATSGKIGAWNIGTVPSEYIKQNGFTNALYSSTFTSTSTDGIEGNTTILRASNNGSHWAYVTIKKNTDNTYEEVFGIKHDGFLKATNVDISGKINATEGDIDGWKIEEKGLSYSKTEKSVTVKTRLRHNNISFYDFLHLDEGDLDWAYISRGTYSHNYLGLYEYLGDTSTDPINFVEITSDGININKTFVKWSAFLDKFK